MSPSEEDLYGHLPAPALDEEADQKKADKSAEPPSPEVQAAIKRESQRLANYLATPSQGNEERAREIAESLSGYIGSPHRRLDLAEEIATALSQAEAPLRARIAELERQLEIVSQNHKDVVALKRRNKALYDAFRDEAEAENARLRELLAGRDQYIVDCGLWSHFVNVVGDYTAKARAALKEKQT